MNAPHLTELADHLAARIARARTKNPDLCPGILQNIVRLEAAHALIVLALSESGDGHTNGQGDGG